MLSLTRAKAMEGPAGEPIHVPFKTFEDNSLFIRRGQFTIIAAAPGGMKSALTQFIVQNGDGVNERNSVLYISADSDADTMLKRSGAMATGWDQYYVSQQYSGDPAQKAGIKKKIDEATQHISWCFPNSAIEQWEFEDQIEGFRAVYGDYPEIIVQDNIMDLRMENVEGDTQNAEAAAIFLAEVASATGAAVIGLHHVVGNHENGDHPMGLDSLRGKISKKPTTVLTLHRLGNTLNISPVKQRAGIADPTGNTFYSLQVEPASMQFRDMPPPASNFQGTGFSNTTLGDRQ